jgi:nitroimidazol reductase NimA-like FMN-containing flavoprotein (pyridoxamine 5'-phosphate oxidase superfamily)
MKMTANTGSWPAAPDPGDLSRRIIQRRTELRLSVTQVAKRAHMNQHYLEYLERFPAHPDGAAMRQLAAALRTTPAALLGGGAGLPDGHAVMTGHRMERLTTYECRKLIAPGGIGRLALVTVSGPIVLPVNYAMIAECVVIKCEPGSTIADHANDSVAFEVDHIDEALGQAWSVLVRGQAHPVLQPAERHNIEAGPAPHPWPQGEHELYVRIVPERITGRRITEQ